MRRIWSAFPISGTGFVVCVIVKIDKTALFGGRFGFRFVDRRFVGGRFGRFRFVELEIDFAVGRVEILNVFLNDLTERGEGVS